MRCQTIPFDSDRVRDFFAGNARDVTPARVRDSIHVRYAPVSTAPEITACCARLLSDSERARAARFIAHESAVRFVQRRAFRRYCGALALGASRPLSRIRFEETEKGRPYLPDEPDLCFSFSACRDGFLGAWSSTCRIGVDLEDPAGMVGPSELARRYFSVSEADTVEAAGDESRRHVFCRFWSLKEAALKSIGEGLPFGLDAFRFELTPEPRIVEAPHAYGGRRRFRAYAIDGTGCCAALVTWSAM